MTNKNKQAFWALVRAGLWEEDIGLLQYYEIDFSEILRMAEEQAVEGLVAAGIEHVTDTKIQQSYVLQFISKTLQIEQRNKAMNIFVAEVLDAMRESGIYTLLIKGQGIAQCYQRPLWRACGDVDLLLDTQNYIKAKNFLIPFAETIEKEDVYCKHLGMTINSWVIEIHGNQHTELSSRIDKSLDKFQSELFENSKFRVWRYRGVDILLPEIHYDILLVFTHFLKHFYKGGIGLRQICDWCRLIWIYRDSIDCELLKERLKRMRLTTEWKTFAAFAVVILGMPAEAMPLYEKKAKWQRKANRVSAFILKVGNFGHNRDNAYYKKYPYLVRKAVSLSRRVEDMINHVLIFPVDSLRFLPNIFCNGMRSAFKGL